MNLVDSCGWLEYLANGSNANYFEPAILDTDNLLVPAICVYEVFKKVYQEISEEVALGIATQMQQGKVVDIDADISIMAAKFSFEKSLPMADSLIWATAQKYRASIWTQDQHFAKIKDVNYVEKKRTSK